VGCVFCRGTSIAISSLTTGKLVLLVGGGGPLSEGDVLGGVQGAAVSRATREAVQVLNGRVQD